MSRVTQPSWPLSGGGSVDIAVSHISHSLFFVITPSRDVIVCARVIALRWRAISSRWRMPPKIFIRVLWVFSTVCERQMASRQRLQELSCHRWSVYARWNDIPPYGKLVNLTWFATEGDAFSRKVNFQNLICCLHLGKCNFIQITTYFCVRETSRSASFQNTWQIHCDVYECIFSSHRGARRRRSWVRIQEAPPL